MADAATEFEALARALKDAGETGLQKELRKAIRDAATPLAKKVQDEEHLKPYMPNRYAEILSEDLRVTISQRTGTTPGVTLRARGRVKGRHVTRLNQGILAHPLFGDREHWPQPYQTIRPRYFDDPVAAAGPELRRQIAAAVHRIIARIYAAP